MKFQAQLFRPYDSFVWKLTPGRLIISCLFLLTISSIIASITEPTNLTIWRLSVLLSIGGLIIGGRWRYNYREAVFGTLTETLKISEQSITTDKEIYNWDSISNFTFNVRDYEDKELFIEGMIYHRIYSDPFSAGINNFISFEYNSATIELQFKIDNIKHLEQFKRTIEPAFFNDHITPLNFQGGLGLSYEELQEYKKKAHNMV
ncbi:hypothetical protein [Reichenbachiella ulvae]|uniref:SMODS-associating 2TM beta-strand rich effector domain-containing protein n=1 Tax=Reichenbachiella ulvae TaxID=2980104 RepID=A0ABT3CTF6_9BACT|nr:hypothetical protein [Reichenbachiella ulvae]MCV9386981.1 hypothetical protein [Reichenbachiella ulvae]